MRSTPLFMVPHLAGRTRPATILQLISLFSRYSLYCLANTLCCLFWFCEIINFLPYFIYCLQHQQSTQTEYSSHPHVMASQSEPHVSCFQTSSPSLVPAFVASGSVDSQSQPVASFPAHMHFLCDVLPCPIQSSHASGQQIITPDISKSHVKTKVPENNLPNEPICKPVPFSQPAFSEAEERGRSSHHKIPERKKKEKLRTKDAEKMIVTRKQKKSRY